MNAIYVGCAYAPVAVFGELWGVSFLTRVYSLSTEVAASVVSTMFIGWAIGSPLIGAISDRIGKRIPMMIISGFASLILLSIILYVPNLPLAFLYVLMFLFGALNTGVSVSYAVSGEINVRKIAGTSVSFANMASVLVGMMFQPIVGWLLDVNWDGKMVNGVHYYSAVDYRWAMLSLIGCLIVCCVSVFFIRETNCKSVVTLGE